MSEKVTLENFREHEDGRAHLIVKDSVYLLDHIGEHEFTEGDIIFKAMERWGKYQPEHEEKLYTKQECIKHGEDRAIAVHQYYAANMDFNPRKDQPMDTDIGKHLERESALNAKIEYLKKSYQKLYWLCQVVVDDIYLGVSTRDCMVRLKEYMESPGESSESKPTAVKAGPFQEPRKWNEELNPPKQ